MGWTGAHRATVRAAGQLQGRCRSHPWGKGRGETNVQSGVQIIHFQVTGALLSGTHTRAWQANSRLSTAPGRESLGMALRCFGLLTVGFSIIYSYQPSILENARFKTLTCKAKRFPPNRWASAWSFEILQKEQVVGSRPPREHRDSSPSISNYNQALLTLLLKYVPNLFPRSLTWSTPSACSLVSLLPVPLVVPSLFLQNVNKIK